MRGVNARRGEKEKEGTQYAIAAFDDWQALQEVLAAIEAEAASFTGAVLHARKDVPPAHMSSALLREVMRLRFARSRQDVACSAGQLAEELAAGLARGARALSDVLGQWLSAHQARQLEHHIESGRLILWLELGTTDDFGMVCARLVQASPHVVELCNVRFKR